MMTVHQLLRIFRHLKIQQHQREQNVGVVIILQSLQHRVMMEFVKDEWQKVVTLRPKFSTLDPIQVSLQFSRLLKCCFPKHFWNWSSLRIPTNIFKSQYHMDNSLLGLACGSSRPQQTLETEGSSGH